MFSATWPKSIQKLASEFLNPSAVKVTLGTSGEELNSNRNVQQIVEFVDPREKDRRLLALLKKYHNGKNRVLVFCLFKKEAARIDGFLKRSGYKNCIAIYGDISQDARTAAYEQFKCGTRPLMVATDVAARGLDIPDIEYVINLTFPLTIEDYVHRIGRTGRGGKKGVAHTFFTINEKSLAGDLVNVLREAQQPVPDELIKFGPSIKKRKEHDMYGAHFKTIGEGEFIPAPKKIVFDDDD